MAQVVEHLEDLGSISSTAQNKQTKTKQNKNFLNAKICLGVFLQSPFRILATYPLCSGKRTERLL
jgi:hypothetical protein